MRWKKHSRAAIGSPMARELAARLRAETDLHYFDERHAQAFLKLLADEMARRIRTRKEVTIPAIGTFHARTTREHLVRGTPAQRVYATLRLTAELKAKVRDALANRDPDRDWQRPPVSPPGMDESRAGGASE